MKYVKYITCVHIPNLKVESQLFVMSLDQLTLMQHWVLLHVITLTCYSYSQLCLHVHILLWQTHVSSYACSIASYSHHWLTVSEKPQQIFYYCFDQLYLRLDKSKHFTQSSTSYILRTFSTAGINGSVDINTIIMLFVQKMSEEIELKFMHKQLPYSAKL